MHYFTKTWACDCFIENTALSKSYDFIADKRCLLFSIILKVLSGWDSYQNSGKMYKIIYKNFWKDFVVEQNLTRLKGDFWCFLNRPYEIVVIWDDWQYGSLVSIIIVFNCTRGGGGWVWGGKAIWSWKLPILRMGKRDWGVDETFLPLGLGFEEIENKKNGFLRITGLWPGATLPH